MKNSYFSSRENLARDETLPLSEVLEQLAFNDRGLIPVITQDANSMQVLMFAWMNREALDRTLATGRMTYWSRSREQLWVKGESSGHSQALVSMSIDCDGDVLLCQVEQKGAACHTGRADCFYLSVDRERQQVRVNKDAI
ncbi:MAG: phosphoribosyl-AMP cyclohydrolase [Gammaproteobacteria bacterium]|nr:phosphoribosyl-AMP cyclohydrolase [Gammaproteobacteria bacterium]